MTRLLTIVIAALLPAVAHAEGAVAKIAAALPWDDIIPLLLTGVVAGIGWLVRHLGKWVKGKTDSDAVKTVVGRIELAAMTVVRSVEQAERDVLVSALEDGEITDVEKGYLKQAAIDGVKASINWKAALGVFGSATDAETHIAHAVEAAVRKMNDDRDAPGPE